MFRALKTWLKNVAVQPDYLWPYPIYDEIWAQYAFANDPRLFQELNWLAQKGQRRYQDAFWYAATLGHMELAVTLLEYDVTVNTETFVHTILNGHVEMIRLLVVYGTDVNAVQPAGELFFTDMTPLMVAVSTGNVEVVQILLDAGALLNTQNKQGQTAPAFVWSSGHREVTRLLIEAGIDIKDREITTLLDRPLKQIHPAIIELLQRAGCQ